VTAIIFSSIPSLCCSSIEIWGIMEIAISCATLLKIDRDIDEQVERGEVVPKNVANILFLHPQFLNDKYSTTN